MKKKVFAVILAAAAICGSLSPVYAADSELVLYTWEGMFPQEVLDGFEEETGCKIVYSNFDTDETMLEKVSMAKGGDYDVVIADDYILEKIVDWDSISMVYSPVRNPLWPALTWMAGSRVRWVRQWGCLHRSHPGLD